MRALVAASLAVASALLAATASCGRAPSGAPDAGSPVCGEMACALFDSPREAFARVLEDRPRILAVGEAHAQRDLGVSSATARFTGELLPTLRGRSTDLVLELWVGNGSCSPAQRRAMREVASAQREVTAAQSPKNPSEFIALWNAARASSMKAHLLVPDCDEYQAITSAPDDVDQMLALIARLSAREAEALLGTATEPIVIYGGAMHNDLAPRAGHERWTFGPELARATGDRYVELDLVVPEMIKDTDAWRAQPWYPHFDRASQGGKTVLFTMRPRSYALIFP